MIKFAICRALVPLRSHLAEDDRSSPGGIRNGFQRFTGEGREEEIRNAFYSLTVFTLRIQRAAVAEKTCLAVGVLARCIVSLTVNSSHAARRTRVSELGDALHRDDALSLSLSLYAVRWTVAPRNLALGESDPLARVRVRRLANKISCIFPRTLRLRNERYILTSMGDTSTWHTKNSPRRTLEPEIQILGIGVTRLGLEKLSSPSRTCPARLGDPSVDPLRHTRSRAEIPICSARARLI